MIKKFFKMAATSFVLLGLAAGAARAADDPFSDDKLHTTLRFYGWLPSVSGSTRLDYPSGGNVDVGQGQVLDLLNMAAMGSAEWRKNRWTLFTDFIYLDMGASKSRSVNLPPEAGGGLTGSATAALDGYVWTTGVGYTMWNKGKSHLDLFGGARMFKAKSHNSLSVSGPAGTESSLDLNATLTLWDGLVGARGRVDLGGPWFMPYYVDVGTGDSKMTSMGQLGVGYAFNWGELTLTYRFMNYDQGDEKLLQNISFHGPALGANFKF